MPPTAVATTGTRAAHGLQHDEQAAVAVGGDHEHVELADEGPGVGAEAAELDPVAEGPGRRIAAAVQWRSTATMCVARR